MDNLNEDFYINDQNSNEQEIINIQESTIKKLKAQISIYKSQLKEQREKIISCDNLIINFNSLNNTYTKIKKENEFLNQKLIEKNITINEYQSLFFESKIKFLLFNQINNILQEKIFFLISKIPKNISGDADFEKKLNFFESKISEIKSNFIEKTEKFKNKLKNSALNSIFDMNESQRKISELEFELSLTKKLNEDYAKEKEEINKKTNDIFNATFEVNKELDDYKNKNKKLKEENNFLTEYFSNKGKELQNILLNIKQGNIKELSQKEDIIKNLIKDKDTLCNIIQELNSKYILLKNVYNKKYKKLKELVDNIEKEKKEDNEIIKKYKNEIRELKEQYSELENKFKIEIEANKIREDKLIKEIEELNNYIKLKINNNISNECEKDNKFYYRCDYCKCNHVLCKECNDKYLINK